MAFGCHVVGVFVNEYSLNKTRSPELWATSWPHLLLGCNLATMNDIVHPPQRESFNNDRSLQPILYCECILFSCPIEHLK